ncbi:unnamed protein product [Rhizoctonia solani]|uniref:Uncharacterized protein n=1 Tax=Rhizoctonia solani TaxID=456999 RepID=A0A8H2XYN9_9AGAM|nr:unnamed protein product [Rhizoctonia solani]
MIRRKANLCWRRRWKRRIPQRVKEHKKRSKLHLHFMRLPPRMLGSKIPVLEDEHVPQGPPGLAQLGKTTKMIQEATSESKDVLKNVHRLPELIHNDQCSVAAMDKYYHVYKNPVNRKGFLASEYGLPQLRYGYYQDGPRYSISFCDDLMARYLTFFDIGSDLVQLEGDGSPKLIEGKHGEGEKLLLKKIGIGPYHY